jgi:octaprenyl-diphosphate synthase
MAGRVFYESYKPIMKDLNRVEDFMDKELRKDGPASELNKFVLNNPGKRMRPALTLFSARSILKREAEEELEKRLIILAAAIELIHNAALIHDDVMDHSALRRGQATVNAGYGSEAAVAFGGYLYSKGLEFLGRIGNPEIMDCLISTASDMCEGELIQILNRGNFQLDRQIYMTIIKKKTASLIASSCSVAIILVDKRSSLLDSFSSFGLNFGVAFQIIDDCLDLVGDRKGAGEPTGLDLKMGEITLPLLFLVESGICRDIKELVEMIYSGRADSRQEEAIREMPFSSGALLRAKDIAEKYIEKAKKDLEGVNNSIFKERLAALTDLTLETI